MTPRSQTMRTDDAGRPRVAATNRRRKPGDTMSDVRRWTEIGLVTAVLSLAPWAAHAEVEWAEGQPFSL